LSECWLTLACRERNPALVFPTAELPKNCPGETCHMRGGPFAHDDTGAKGNGDVDWISILENLLKFCSWSPVGIESISGRVMGPQCYNPPSFSFYSLPQAPSGPVILPAPTTQIPQNISQPMAPPLIPPRACTPTLPTTFNQAIPAIPITWPTHTRHHSSMEYFTEPTSVITDPTTESDGDSPMRDRSPSPPHVPYQPRPSGSNVYQLETNKQPSPPWKAWLSQPSPPNSHISDIPDKPKRPSHS